LAEQELKYKSVIPMYIPWVKEHVPLKSHTSYQIGGPARYFATPGTDDELGEAITRAKESRLPIFVLGGGTNLLVSDDGFEGWIIRPEQKGIERDGTDLIVGAGAQMRDLVAAAEEAGLAGLAWAGGLPGTVGGAVRGNAGAFSGEIKDTVVEVKSMSLQTGNTETHVHDVCAFGYRTSIFKEQPNAIITTVRFHLEPGDREALRAKRMSCIAYRNEKHPMEYPNAGSVFKNIPLERVSTELQDRFRAALKNDPFPVLPVAALLATADLKGKTHGGAMISTKHPNFIVNARDARASDVLALIAYAKKKIEDEYGIALEAEVMHLSS
jgi:UDP-N-acetylmuramate dehydrogenase